jgi:hypothetical protein
VIKMAGTRVGERSMDRGVTPATTETVIPRYHQALDFEALWREFPPAPDYFSGTYRLSREELRVMQGERFLRQMARAWQVPFYRRHWGAAGDGAGRRARPR